MARIGTRSRACIKENAGDELNSPPLLGQSSLLHTFLGLPHNDHIYSDALPEAIEIRDNEASNSSCSKPRIYEPLHEEDGMEFEGIEASPLI